MENNICQECGGLLRIEYVMGFERCKPRDMRCMPNLDHHLCPGHDHPAPTHDGNLDGLLLGVDHHAEVEIISEEDAALYMLEETAFVRIAGGYGDIENRAVYLDPAQFSSLLTWGEQHKHELKKSK